ncbi:centromere protein V [Eurytemora carolleeae]|uniref:centromere protein V n=1 Tax=Eurytemora carolleeae TaxID=1294199 RepID=UPI000C768EA7|nr:centromere protein V [Eurytemora carolleeae]|eukprot:XP_023341645.1 centromere protein V-like [Eurytemora affinis]
MEEKYNENLIEYTGGCHCGKVGWNVLAPALLKVVRCNCSVCRMKMNDHVIVPENRFILLFGKDNLQTYTFNTHQARHLFCKNCGVQSFYRPRSNPGGVGFMPHCILSPDIQEIQLIQFDGKDWEKSYHEDKLIKSMSN